MSFDGYLMVCIRHIGFIQNSLATLKTSCGLRVHQSPPKPLATVVLFTFYNFTISRMPCSWNHTVLGWLLSLSSIHLRFISFHGLMAHIFKSPNNIPLYGCTTVCLSLPIERRLDYFQFWWLWIKPAVNIFLQVFV